MASRHRGRRIVAVLLVAAIVVAIGLYEAVRHHLPQVLAGAGCVAGDSRASVPLDPQQAAIAATIAGVAHRRAMPPRAVTVAYAAAMQESKMHDLDYGDRDSVGVFQQRPSEGWGPARKLKDPVYASSKFLGSLAKVPDYLHIPIYQAAQAVQRSADGQAYIQYQPMASQLTQAFTGGLPHAVSCWSSAPITGKPSPRAAAGALSGTFGSLRTQLISEPKDAPALAVTAARPALGWTVAAWLVTHAPSYHLTEVSYDGYWWRSSAGTAGWTRDKNAVPAATVLAS